MDAPALPPPSFHSHRPAPSQGTPRKLFHWKPDGTLELRIDWSSLESFLSCNRLAQYKLVHSKSPQPKSALVFGAAMHAALEIWYRNKENIGKIVISETLQPTNPVVGVACEILTRETLLQRCYLAIETTFAEYPIGFINDYRTPEYCINSFCAYLQHYSGEVLTPFTHQSKPLVEFSFSYPLGQIEIPTSVFQKWGYGKLSNDAAAEEFFAEDEGRVQLGAAGLIKCSIEWTGIIDMLADMSGELWVMDHKTTSILSSDFFDSFELAMQPVGYVAAARAAFPDLDIKGFLVNVLSCRKPVSAVTASGKKSTAKPFEAHRRFYRYEEWKEAEFRKDALTLIEELIANLDGGYFPKKTSWCSGKYGKCAFFEVCNAPEEQRDMILSCGTFTDNTWKPV